MRKRSMGFSMACQENMANKTIAGTDMIQSRTGLAPITGMPPDLLARRHHQGMVGQFPTSIQNPCIEGNRYERATKFQD